jgi:hypothetical protein
VSRIWKAIQHLGEAVPAEEHETAPAIDVPPLAVDAAPGPEAAPATPVAPQSPHVAPEEPSAKTSASRAKKAPVAATTKDAGQPREGSKTGQVIAMLKRESGTTLEEIMRAMG